MAIKKAPLDVVNDSLDTLRNHLAKLKKDEAKLELALTLREFPTIEEALTRIVTCVIELGVIEYNMRLESAQSDQAAVVAKQHQTQQQIDSLKARILTLIDNEAGRKLRTYYTQRIADLELSKHSVGMTKKNLKFLEHYERTLRNLLVLTKKFDINAMPAGFDIYVEIPKLEHYLPIAEDLVARKGP